MNMKMGTTMKNKEMFNAVSTKNTILVHSLQNKIYKNRSMKNSFLTPSLKNWLVGVVCMIALFLGAKSSVHAQNLAITYTSPSTFTVPSGVTSITIKAKGGAGGYGGNDGFAGAVPGGLGYVHATYSVNPGDVIGIYPGNKGSNGASAATNSGGGAGGSSTYGSYSGGWGGNAASSGSSGGGGGGGAATIVTKNSSLIIVAAGGGGGGGAGNCANSATDGSNSYVNNGTTYGGNGNYGNSCGSSDGGGGGGGGGGANGGSGGVTAWTACGGECGGMGGYIGSNSITGALSIVSSMVYGNTNANGDVIIEYTAAGGAASANQTFCAGNTPANLTLSGYIGNIQWQVSTNNSTWSDISGATSATLSSAQMGALTATRYYRAWISGVIASNVVTITVNPVPSPMTISNNLCTPNQILWANMTSITPTTATGVSQSGITISVTQAGGGMETQSPPGMYNSYIFPAQYNVPSSGSIIRNLNAGMFTACFSQPVTDPYFAFASIGNPNTGVPIITSAPYQMIWTNPGTITQNSATQFTGNEGFAIVKIPGIHTCVSFNYTVAEFYSTIAFGFGDQDCTAPTVCNGSSVSLTATGSTNYVWTPSTGLNTSTGATVVATPSVSTTYQVTNPDDACAQPVSILVNVNPLPGLSSVSNKVVCKTTSIPAQSVTSSISGTTFAWTNSNTAIGLAASGTGSVPAFTSINNTSAPITATITITGTAPTGCQSQVTYTITVNPTPTVNQPTSQTLCAGASTTATAFTGSTTGATYTWSNSNTAIGLAASGTGDIPVFTATNATNATISSTVTVTPSYGATGSIYGEVSQNGTLNLTAPTGTVFTGVTFASYGNPTGSLGNYTLGSCNAANSTSVVSGLALGNNSVSILASDATFSSTACSGSNSLAVVLTYGPSCQGTPKTFTYTINPGPIVSTTQAATICTGTSFTVTPTNGSGNILPSNVTYSWSAPSVTGITGTASTTGATSISGTLSNTTSSPINVVYTVTPTSGSCQGATFPVTVTVNPTISIANVNSSICSGSAFTTTPVNGAGTDLVPNATQYTWTVTPSVLIAGETNQTTPQSTISQTLANNGTSAQQVVYTVTPQFTNSGLTCIGAPFTNTVTVMNAVPTVSVGANQTICQNTTASFTATTTNASSGYWSTTGAGTISPNLTNSTVIYTPTATESGTVQITYFATNICGNNSASASITINTLPTVASITGNTTVCVAATSTLSSTTTGGVWSSSNTAVATVSSTGVVTGVSAGTATITYSVTTAGCTNSKTAVVTVNPLPTATITTIGSTVLCSGGNVNLVAPSAPTGMTYSYQWNLAGSPISGATGSSYSANAAGSYTLTVTTNNSCTATSVATLVTLSPIPTATITAGGATTFCSGSSVTLTANAGSTYLWSNGASTQSITVSTSGSYYVSVTNASGCSATSTTTNVTVNPSPIATVVSNGPTSFCPGGNVSLTAGTASTYLWSNNATTQTINVATSGTYTVTLTNALGCSSTSLPVAVTVFSTPTATITAGGATTFCQGGNVTLNANVGTGLSYQWSNNTNDQSLVATVAGAYTVTVTDANGCSATSAATNVTVNALPTATAITGTTALCVGTTTTLSTTSTNPTWTSLNAAVATVSATGVVTGVTAGTATITYSTTNANGCSNTASTSVTVNPLPSATIATIGNTTFCQGGSVTLLADNAPSGSTYVYQWRLNGTAINGATANTYVASASGNYSVTIIANNLCQATSANTTVTVNPLPVLAANTGASSVCQGSTTTLANSTAGGSWTSSDNSIATINLGLGIITGETAGNVQFTYTYTNANGCTSTTTTNFTVNSLPNAVITANGPTTFCQGANVTLTASPGSSYLWSNGATTASIVTSTTGNNIVTVTNANGCSAVSAPMMVTVNPLPVAAITANGPTTFCQGGSVTLVASTGVSYLWSTNNAFTQSNTITTSGTYNVTVTSADGCTATSAPVTVTVNPLPTPTITASGATTFCQGGNVTLTASSGTAYLWSSGETSQSIIANVDGPYSVQVTNANGCQATSANTNLVVYPLPAIAAITGANAVCEESTVVLASTTAGGTWSSSNVAAATINSTGVVSGVAAGNAVLTYSITDANGCTNSVSATMTVKPFTAATISASGSTTFCEGGNVTLTASPGVSYMWYPGDLNPSITVSTSGTYFVNVTNASGCTAQTSIQVIVNPLPVVAPITGITNVCVGLTTQLADVTTGGVWSSSNNNIATVDAAGLVTSVTAGSTVITYTVTNANGCTSSVSTTVNVNALPTAVISAIGSTTFCAGGSVTLVATTGTNYLWNNGQFTQSIIADTSGTYFVTVTNAAGCTANSNSINVTVNALPIAVVTPNGPTTFCQGNNVLLTATGGSTYVWSTGETTSSITVSTNENIQVDVTNANGCTSAASNTIVTVLPVTVATITAIGPTAICLGSNVTLSANSGAGLTYLWSNGVTTATTQNITVSNAGVYTVTVTNASGCTSTASQTVIVNVHPAVTVTANGSTLFCQGGSVTLTATGAAEYQWNNGATTSSITVNAAGSYFVVGTNLAGCETTSATTVVTTSTIPTVAAITGLNNVCEGGTINLTSSTNNGIWTSANNFIATVSNTGIVTGLNAGTTTITYTVTNGACSNAVTAVVNVMNNPVVPIITPSGATTMCPGGTVILFASNAANYAWSNGPSTPFITVNQTGNYAVTVTNASGCSSTSLPINVFIGDNTNPVIVPPANITMAPNFGCDAIGVNLGAPNATDNCSVATVSHDAPAIFPLGLTTVTWTVVDGSGNTSTATQLVNIVDNILPIINVNDITVIINDNGSTTITFSDVNNGTSDNCGIASMTLSQYTFGCADIGDNTITVTVTDNNGNVATSTVLITVVTSGTDTDNDGMLNACDMDDDADGINDVNEVVGDTDGDGIPNSLDPDDDGDGISTIIEGTSDVDGDGIPNYLDSDSDGDGVSDDFEWDFGGLGEPGQDCDNDGVYDFLDTDLCGPVIPEAFTPNGNGFNDYFVIPGIEGYKTRQVSIYSRYGTKVYESNEYNNDWDGTLLNTGTQVPDGTYYYIFTFDNGLVVNGYVYINRVQK
jgi:gliding motility-associated-like protein